MSETDQIPPENRDMIAGPSFPGRVIAALLDVTERRLQQLAAEGWIPRAERGNYGLRASVRGYINFLKQSNRDNQRGQEGARLARAQATKVEMENYRRMGELQVTSQVDETMQGLVVMMKSAHEGMPGRLSSELAGISDAPRIYQRLQTELRNVLNQCADYLAKRAEALGAMPETGEPVAAVGETDADDVGGTAQDNAIG